MLLQISPLSLSSSRKKANAPLQCVIVQSLSCVTLCDPMDCSVPDLPILHHLLELKLMSIESVMPSNHLILCFALILLPSTCPSIRVFSNVMQCYIYVFLDSTWSTTLRMHVSSFIDFFQEIKLAHILSIHKLTRNLTFVSSDEDDAPSTDKGGKIVVHYSNVEMSPV